MSDRIAKILSHNCGAFWQFVKYGVIGVMSTMVQTAVFYLLAATVLKCLAAGDWAVRFAGLPSVDIGQSARALRFAAATGLGFVVSNVFCWLMNRWFVFRAGKFGWFRELAFFMSVSGLAMAIATGLGYVLIHRTGLMTTVAVGVEITVSFVFNYFMRRFVIFKG